MTRGSRKGDGSRRDAGFVLFEVLVAAAILAMAGSMILLIGSNTLSSSERGLDRSMALVNAESFGKELALIGADRRAAIFPADDGTFVYSVSVSDEKSGDPPAGLVQAHIEASSKATPPRHELSLEIWVAKRGLPAAR